MSKRLPKAFRGRNMFEPLPWQRDVMNDLSPVVFLTGSVGGGKSLCSLNKVHACCMYYPNVTAVCFRKKYSDVVKSIKIALMYEVIGLNGPAKWLGADRMFLYPNGSMIILTGILDESAREGLRSIGKRGAIDIAFVDEAVETVEEDYGEILMRMRGTAMGWTQLILASNPGPPLHYLNRRLIIGGEASVHLSDRSMNPYLPKEYDKNISQLTGVQKLRLVDGLWAAGSGLVIDSWNPHENITEAADYIPGGGDVVLAADDGYAGELDEKSNTFSKTSHPRALLLVQLRPDGSMNVFYEDYRVKTRADTHINAVLDACAQNGWPRPRTVFYDRSSASLRLELEASGFTRFYPNIGNVVEELKELNLAIGADENGVRLMKVHPRCHHLKLEFSSYSYDNKGNIIKAFDHGPDALKALAYSVRHGAARPVDIAVGSDKVDIKAIKQKIEDAYKAALEKLEAEYA